MSRAKSPKKQNEKKQTKNMKLYIILYLIALYISYGCALTEVGAPITAPTKWTRTKGPYIVRATLSVLADLTIESGTEVRFDKGKGLLIEQNGRLLARGTLDAPILFTSNSLHPAKGDWIGIGISGANSGSVLDGNGLYSSGSILSHCTVEYAGKNTIAAVSAFDASLWIENTLIQHSVTAGVGSDTSLVIMGSNITDSKYGIWLSSSETIHLRSEHNSIHDNDLAGVYIEANEISKASSILIKSSSFERNSVGISVTGTAHEFNLTSNTYLGDSIILNMQYSAQSRSYITENRMTGDFSVTVLDYTISSGQHVISNNLFEGVTSPKLANIQLASQAIVKILANQFVENMIGLSAIEIINTQGEIYFKDNMLNNNTFDTNLINIRGNGLTWVQYNSFLDNTPGGNTPSTITVAGMNVHIQRNIFLGYTIQIHVAFTLTTEYYLDAVENYFGAYNTNSSVSDHLYDFFTDSSYGLIQYSPYLLSPTFTSDIGIDYSINMMEGDFTWTAEQGVVLVKKVLFISENTTLTIAAGVTVYMDSNASIINNGKLVILGNTTHPVTISKMGSENWSSIIFTKSAAESVVDANGNYISGSRMEYVTIQHGGSRNAKSVLYFGEKLMHLLHVTVQVSNSSAIYSKSGLVLHNCTFSQNSQTHVVIRGETTSILLVIGTVFKQGMGCACDIRSTVTGLQFIDNQISGNRCGAKIDVSSATLMTISGNLFWENTYSGLDLYIAGNCNIYNNTLQWMQDRAVYLFVYSGIVRFEYNIIWYNRGGYITQYHMNSACGSYSELRIRNNTIQYNNATSSVVNLGSVDRIQCYGRSIIYFEYNIVTMNIIFTSTSASITIAGHLALLNRNLIENMGQYELQYSGSIIGKDLDCSQNWWGTQDSLNIQARIIDIYKNARYGAAIFSPFLSTASFDSQTQSQVNDPQILSIQEDTVVDGTMTVEYDLIIEEGSSLTLNAGAELALSGSSTIIVKGQLIVLGEPGNEVTITVADGSQNGWNSILFTETAISTILSEDNGYESGSIISNAVIRRGGYNAEAAIVLRTSVLIVNTTVELMGSYAINSRNGLLLDECYIKDCQAGVALIDNDASIVSISRSKFETVSTGWALSIISSSSLTSFLSIENNIISDCSKGLYVDFYGQHASISNNELTNNEQAGMECTMKVVNPDSGSFIVSDNLVSQTTDGCAFCLNSTESNTEILVQRNVITQNSDKNPVVIDIDQCSEYPVVISDNTISLNSASESVVYLKSSLCSASSNSTFTRNVLTDNTFTKEETVAMNIVGDQFVISRNLFENEGTYELRNGNDLTNYLDVRENWFGTDYANDVKHSFYDTYVSFLSGRFIYAPFLTNSSLQAELKYENCSYGYIGGNCELFDCSTLSNCSNHGKCVYSFTCECNEGWMGDNCSEFNCYKVNNCSGNGVCTGANQCSCETGWKGEDCDTVDCSGVNYCSNHGVCSGPNQCDCATGWMLDDCSLTQCYSINSTDSTVCSGLASHGWCSDPDTCICSSSWDGPQCQIPVCYGKSATHGLVCSGHGDCTNPDTCQCQDGWSGNQCQHAICYGIAGNMNSVCSTNGTCTSPDHCSCGAYLGAQCEYYQCFGLNITDNSVCSSRGSCIAPDSCHCSTGYTGNRCQYNTCYSFSEIDFNTCSSNGYCKGVDSCECFPGYAGSRCEYPICFGEYLNPCSGSIQGSCVNPDECVCSDGYTGAQCEYPVCYGKNSSDPGVCSGRGQCNHPNTCSCTPGYDGPNCQFNVCYGISSNSSSVCSSHGNCTAPDQCNCTTGYFGSKCENTYCNSIASTNSTVCSSRGTCTSLNKCSCRTGYTGTNCEYNVCFGKSQINSQVCSGFGNCTAPNNCTCTTGHSGSYCQYVKCYNKTTADASVCSGHGQCTSVDKCVCISGYVGSECQYPVCYSKNSSDTTVCSSKGTCVAPNTCNCTVSGYGGNNCELTKCFDKLQNDTSVCSGHGTCESVPAPGTCVCSAGYTAANCSVPICFGLNSTNAAACSGHGLCVSPDTCTCSQDYTAQDCSALLPMTQVSTAGWSLVYTGRYYSQSDDVTKFQYRLTIDSTERSITNITLGFENDPLYIFISGGREKVLAVDPASGIKGVTITSDFAAGYTYTFNVTVEGQFSLSVIDYSITGGRKYTSGVIEGPGLEIQPPRWRISGVVFLDENNDGIKNSNEVELYSVFVNLYESNTGTLVRASITDATGYSFDNLPETTYVAKLDPTKGLLATAAGKTVTNSDLTYTFSLKRKDQVVNFPLQAVPIVVDDTCDQCSDFLGTLRF